MSIPRHPDFRRGFLRVPLRVWLEVYCQAPLTRRQLQLISFVIRESWGWQSQDGQVYLWTRPLSSADFARATRLNTDHIRRDLRTLTFRRILLEREQRYHFVADMHKWITPLDETQEVTPFDADSAESAASLAPSAPSVKKGNIEERNVQSRTEDELSTGVDNRQSSLFDAAHLSADTSEGSLAIVERVVAVVTAFVGSLSPQEAEGLRDWICRDGVATVWRTLEPSLRKGLPFARDEVTSHLGEHAAEQENKSRGREGA